MFAFDGGENLTSNVAGRSSSSGRINTTRAGQNLGAHSGLETVSGHEIDAPAEQVFESMLHPNQREQTHALLREKLDQKIDVAFGPEIFSQCGSKHTQFAHTEVSRDEFDRSRRSPQVL